MVVWLPFQSQNGFLYRARPDKFSMESPLTSGVTWMAPRTMLLEQQKLRGLKRRLKEQCLFFDGGIRVSL
ncbi:hypothetical protein ES288_D11G382900v1 [Gossypium darwinii]|uniref:Uncharacterized protein n=1 Tax=Gossypium darwinii TaxID=34276 RepID=A0A5D2ASS1_GOSDA|nr:hypothetical protein ES288_D11G382900v1 [Gossypium darwinii]